MTTPRPVTDAEVATAWHDFYDLTVAGREYVMREPNPNDEADRQTLDGLRQVLERERQRAGGDK